MSPRKQPPQQQADKEVGGGEGEAGAASENNLIINYLPSHVTEIELRVSHPAYTLVQVTPSPLRVVLHQKLA